VNEAEWPMLDAPLRHHTRASQGAARETVGRIAQLVEQRTENPSSYHLKALQSVSFSNSIMKFYEGKLHFQSFWQRFCSVPALNLQK